MLTRPSHYRSKPDVAACESSRPRFLSLEPENLDEIIDALDLVGLVGQRTASVRRGVLGFIAVAEDCIGANQPHPAVDIFAVGAQPIGQTLHHAANHFGTLGFRHVLSRRNIGRAWPSG